MGCLSLCIITLGSLRAVEPGQPPLEGRLIQCFLYTRTPGMAEDNHYAHPLDMVVNLDLNSRKARGLLCLC